ncbi:FAD binding domain-containing protein [Hoyosella altamirensis]|uniref:CO/xanthine dehydrogenase FAD-binding subunit n=1 Tax=Hoyosella altamirensis TaxID=616997 RepID=A0A839RUK8_9ACTN|nr:FAD binding domain-containing protein [Hoyosella altamirensis]MBB3039491.1 CO/xanthine dehydrogenase FAD-binding subunit [Hoyosella altamirensis]
MDLPTIEAVVTARSRDDLRGMAQGDGIVAGGTWIFSEPQNHLTRLVDLTTMGWTPLTVTPGDAEGLEIAATCTIEELISYQYPRDWVATALFRQCAESLLASFKVWKAATVGGNICMGLPAGSMISLTAALDATLLIWCPDGSERTSSVLDFVVGDNRTTLRSGEVLRSIHIPAAALRSRAVLRRISLAPLGRSGSLVIARVTASGPQICVSGATDRPYIVPASMSLYEAIPETAWYTDAHGTADWRRSVTALLVEESLAEIGSPT